jgi:Na+-driven multidrug efflux pump
MPMKAETLLSEFFRYVILNICGIIGLSCYILADTYFISNGLGVNGLTALNLAIPIYSFIHGSGLMFGIRLMFANCHITAFSLSALTYMVLAPCVYSH